MSGNSSQRIRDRNKQALLNLKNSRTFSEFGQKTTPSNRYPFNDTSVLPTEMRVNEPSPNPPQIISQLRSQKDLFVSHYRPSLRKSQLRIEDGLIPSDSKFDRRSPRSPKSRSGRVSQLASGVERLFIQDSINVSVDVRTEIQIPTPSDRASTFRLIDFNERPDPDNLNSLSGSHLSKNAVSTSSSSSPWYRYCRPKAPLIPPNGHDDPHRSDDLPPIRGDVLRSESSSSLDSPYDMDPLKPLRNTPILFYSNRTINSPEHPIQLNALETDIGQENINWDSEFILPPPPPPPPSIDNGNFNTNADYSDLDRSFSLPSPPLSEPGPDENCSTVEDFTVKPLASIANIMPFHGKYGHRCPKWSIDNPNRILPNRFLTQTNRNANQSPITVPSPPPLIMERLPSLITTTANNNNNDTEWPQPLGISSFAPSSIPTVARPTVLKREAPDGAEHTATEPAFVCELKRKSILDDTSCNSSSSTKRLSDLDSISLDYSPKKSRTRLLLPSEHSAFLPVNSARLLHRVSSPCVR